MDQTDNRFYREASSDDGYAFPQHGWTKDPEARAYMANRGGMTLRDYFAAKALIGLMTEPIAQGYTSTAFELTKDENLVDTFAISAYKIADAMLAARGGK